MRLILLAAAAWSIGLGLYQALKLGARPASSVTGEMLAEWVSALSLVGAGIWAWESRSWLALVSGYAIGWAMLYLLPVPRQGKETRRTA
jgi:hypothetical protein